MAFNPFDPFAEEKVILRNGIGLGMIGFFILVLPFWILGKIIGAVFSGVRAKKQQSNPPPSNDDASVGRSFID